MQIITLEPEKFQEYASNHRYRNFYQTVAYGNTMKTNGYDIHYLGFIDDNEKLIGASLIIFKEVFMGNKMAYAPRGMLFNYGNVTLLQELMTKLKKLLSKQGFMSLKIDPFIPVNIRSKHGNILNSNQEAGIILENLKASGFQYHGNNLYFENEKPRFEAIVTLNRDIKIIFNSFDKRTRYKIKKAMRSGIEIEKGELKDLPAFYEFVKRKHPKKLSYYEDLWKNFGNDMSLYFAKINTENFVVSSKKLYEKEIEHNESLNKKIQDSSITGKKKQTFLNEKMESDKLLNTYKNNLVWATSLLKEHPNGMIVGSALTLMYDQASYMIIEGFHPKYKELNPNYLIKWRMIEDAKEKKCKYISFNGISGEFENAGKYQGLNEMKLGYNAVVTEFIGEFDYTINNLTYNLYKNFNKEKGSSKDKNKAKDKDKNKDKKKDKEKETKA